MIKHAMDRRSFLVSAAAGLAAPALGWPRASSRADWALYAFGNAFKREEFSKIEDNCKLLKDLGYAGLEAHLDPKELPRLLKAVDANGLKLFGIYTTPNLESPAPDWGEWIKLLKGRSTRIEMGIRSKSVKRSDPAGDEKAIALVKAVSDLCADTGPVVSIYPHAGFWTERVEDGVRLAKALARKNVGTNFNLVHWQWVKQTRQLEGVLKEALPHLFLVTLNGLKGPASGRQKIRPLDDSDYDLAGFLSLVRKIGYTGPMGLQCWSVKEPPPEHLKRSMTAWRKLVETSR